MKKLKVYNKLLSLCKTYPDHLQDYREKIGYEYRGVKLYGMGIAETMGDKKLANRMKKRGKRTGLISTVKIYSKPDQETASAV